MQMYYRASRRIAVINETFIELVKEGMTHQDLETNIKRRPSLWAQFAGWVDKLPDSKEVWEDKECIYEQFMSTGAYFDVDYTAYKSKLYEVYLRTFNH